MKKIVSFIWFLIYIISIFFIKSAVVLGIVTIINLILIISIKINFKHSMISLIKLIPFILFTVFINWVLVDFKFGILIGFRLILVCNISYIYSKTITIKQFGEIIEKIFYPLKVFKINPKEIGLIFTIAISFIPIMKKSLKELKDILKVKGIKTSNINMLKNINIIFKPFIVSIFQKTNEIEYLLKAKGY